MKQLYLFLLFSFTFFNAVANNNSLLPSATITGTTAVCQNAASPLVTFTGSGGTAPYTFTYTRTGLAGNQTITTTGTNSSVTVAVPTGATGTFIYTLVSVTDSQPPNNPVNVFGTATVIVSAPPTVNFTFTNDNTCSGTSVQFTSNVTGTGPYIYSWDFGDSTALSTQINPTHVFTSLGCGTTVFTVTLTITGGGCSVTRQNMVTVKQKPNISFNDPNATSSANQFSNCTIASLTNTTYSITVENTSLSSGCITSYSINWGDTTPPQNNINFPISHTYTQLGVYSMVITGNGNFGCSNSITYQVKNISNPSAGVLNPGGTVDMCIPTPIIQYTIGNWAQNSPGTSYAINYGDNSPIVNISQSTMVASPYYNALNPLLSANYPIPYSYTTNSCPNGGGDFIITLVVTNTCRTTTGTVVGGNTRSKPIADFTAPLIGCVTSSILFSNTTILGYDSGCLRDTRFTWNFGDPSSGTNNTVTTGWVTNATNGSHIFSGTGVYTVTLTAQNGCGTTTKTQQICIESPLTPQFTLSTLVGCSPLNVATANATNLTNACPGNPTYLWNVVYTGQFCGTAPGSWSYVSGSASSANPSFNFVSSGTYSISLTTTNSCGTVTSPIQTVVVKKPPTVTINTILTFCQNLNLTPVANINLCSPITTGTTYLWTFSGGTSANSANSATPPTISYAVAGSYAISLAVTNECGTTTATSNTFTVQAAPIVQNETTTICSGTSFSITPSNATAGNFIPVGSTYSWSTPVVTGSITGGIAGTNQTSITGTLTNPTTSPQTATYTINPKIGTCTGNSFTLIVIVNPSPTVIFSPAPQTLCSGDTSAIVNLSSAATGVTFNWTAAQPVGITGVATSGANTIPAQTLTNTTNAPITITYNATATTSGGSTCAGALYPYTIMVKPKPSITQTFTITTCSGTAFTITPAVSTVNVIPTGTNYSWTAPTVTGGITGGAAGNAQTAITGTLNNPTDTAQTATYTVTPSNNGCPGTPFSITVTVNPKPLISNVAPLAICSGGTFSVTPTNGSGNIVTAGTTYTWTVNSNTTITGQSASNATGITVISQTLTNNSNIIQVLIYTITPLAGTCPGGTFTATITVNPRPLIGNLSQTICSGGTFTVTPANGPGNIVPVGTTYTWTNPVSNPLGAITGESSQATGQNNISQTLTNTSNAAATITYTVTPTSGNCPSNPFTVTITVIPVPSTLSLVNQTYCNGIPTATIIFNNSVIGTTYTWTNSNTAIGLVISGTGNIPAFTPTNSGNTAISGVISVIASFNGCPRPAETFNITVISSPIVIFSPAPQAICSGDTAAAINLTSTATGATFSWTATQPADITGVATSGTNTIPTQTLTNATSAPITITYNATATTSSGSTCAGALYPYTIIVKPRPSITEAFTATICSGDLFTITPANNTSNSIPSGTTYSWGIPTVTGGMTGGASGNAQTNITGTVNNPTDSAQTATYNVTPSVNGCSGTPFTITVSVNPKPVIASVVPAAICSEGTFTVTPANGSGNIVPIGTSYTWTVSNNTNISGQSASNATGITFISQTLTNLSNANQSVTYTVTPISGSCPGAIFTITISVNPKPTIVDIAPSAICSGAAFTATPSNGNGNIVPIGTTYIWNNPVSNPLGAITGGTTQATPQINISQTLTNTSNALATLTYTVTPNSGNCPGNPFTVTITVNPIPSALTLTDQTYCNGITTSVIVFNNLVTGTTYSWTNSNTAIGLGANGTGNIPAFTPTNSGNTAVSGVITVIASFNGCPRPAETFNIAVISSPTVIFSPVPQSICSGDTSVLVNLSSVATGATFTWTASQPAGITGVATSGTNTIPAQTLTNSTSAPINITYNATATTSGGSTCVGASNSYTIIVKPRPSITEPFTAINCSGETFSITPSNSVLNSIPIGTNYSWNVPSVTGGLTGGASENAQTTITGTLNNPTDTSQTATYNVIPTSDGCTGNPFVVTIIVDPKPFVADIITPDICSGEFFNVSPLSGSGNSVPIGTTYTWTISSNTNINGQSASSTTGITSISQTLTNLSNTNQLITYTVTPLSGSCLGQTFTVTVNVNPKADIADISSATICSGGSFTVIPSNGSGNMVPLGTTYTWSNPVSNPIGAVTGGSAATTGQTSISQSLSNTTNDLATLTYTTTPTSGFCLGNPFTISVTLSPSPVIAATTATICSSTTFTVAPTNGGGNIVPTGTTYTWSAPTINPAGTITGASAQVTPQTNISQTLINTTTNPATVTYTVTPTSGTCIGTTFSITITVNPAINPNVVVTNNSCFGVNTASITTAITGGIAFSSGSPYQITWTGPNGFTSLTSSISNIAPGNYSITIADAGGCPFSNTYTITEPADIVIAVDSENDITCFNSANGSVDITVTGGTGNYVYTWTKNNNPYASTQDISNLSPGTYTVSVTDVNNCGPKTATFTITEPPLLVVNLVSQTNVLCFGAATGAITVNVVGGTLGAGYNFSWTGPNGYTSATQNLTNIFAGTYNLIVTDSNGCQKNLTVTITQSTDIIIAFTTTPITCYGANNASLTVTLSGGNSQYQYQWSNLATTLVQTNLSAGNYTITVTDNVGCPKIQTINIPEVPVFTVNPIVSNITCFGANNGSINLNLTGGITPVTLVWSDGSTSGLTRNNLVAGTYTATISDGTPCYIVRTFTIVEPAALVLSANSTNANNCTNANSGAIDLIVAGGTQPYTYSWTGSTTSTTQDLNNITSGNYLVTVTDANGCIKTAQYSITRPAPILINVTTQTTADCASHSVNQNFIAQASGGVPPYTYSWSNGTIGTIMNTTVNGTYTVTANDSSVPVGCPATQTVVVDTPELGYASFDTTSFGYISYGIYSIGDPIQFQSNITGDYISVSWDFGDGTFSTELNPIHTYVIPKDYIVTQTVTYPFGCVYVQTISLLIEKGYILVVPTAFTPNGDSLNDTFRPVTKNLKNVHLDVYDTWGSLIFSETGDVLVGWDAKIKSFNAENGNYYCKVSGETFYGTIVNENHTFVLIK